VSSGATACNLSMKRNRHLRLSRFTVPELSIGRAPLTPQNSQFDPRRLKYLEGMVAYLNGLFAYLRKDCSQSEALSRLENPESRKSRVLATESYSTRTA
jgi:hypothetical protein